MFKFDSKKPQIVWSHYEANVSYWSKYLWHCWNFSEPPYWFGAQGIVLPCPPRYAPALHVRDVYIWQQTPNHALMVKQLILTLTRMWRWCQVQPSQKEREIGAVHCKMRECCYNFSVGVALKVWFSYARYMKMTRDEHIIGFKSCDISTYWWIWMLSFLLKQIWIGIDYFLLNFFATFDSVSGRQIAVTL